MFPILAQVGPVHLYTHDFFTVAGLIAGLALYYRALRRDRILDGRIAVISLCALLGGALGARLATSWEILDEVNQAGLPLTYLLTHGPRSILGGLAGGYAAIVLSRYLLRGERAAELVALRTKRLTVKSFMDAWTMNIERLQQCCVHVGSVDGESDPVRIPFCARQMLGGLRRRTSVGQVSARQLVELEGLGVRAGAGVRVQP
jgi:hypothetical protein